MSGGVTSADFRDLKGAHNNLTEAHDKTVSAHNKLTAAHDHLQVKHNLTVQVVNQQGQKIRHLEDLSEADTRRVDAVVQVMDAQTIEFRRLQVITDELSRGLVAANEALAASERARVASEEARQEERQSFDDRIKKLEENSTATTAISSQVNSLMERFATLEHQKEQYAQRLIRAEATIIECHRENREMQVTVATLCDVLEQVTMNAVATHNAYSSVLGKVNGMDSKLDLLLQRIPEGTSLSSGQTVSNSPPPSAATQPVSPIRHPFADPLAKLLQLRQRQESQNPVQLPSVMLSRHPAATAEPCSDV